MQYQNKLVARKVPIYNPTSIWCSLQFDLHCIHGVLNFQKMTNFHTESEFTEEQAQNVSIAWPALSMLPWPGFEPGLLRPQRRVLTTIRSRLQWRLEILIWLDGLLINVEKKQNNNNRDIDRFIIFATILATYPRIDDTMTLCNNIIFLQVFKFQRFG